MEPLPPPRWPACPWLCREGVRGAKTGSSPWTDIFFLSLWAGAQGTPAAVFSSGWLCTGDGVGILFPKWEVLPSLSL